MRHKILLVEDNDINQMVVLGLLESAPVDIAVAEHGVQALEMLSHSDEELPYELILMDYQMPLMDGLETSTKIREGLAGDKYSCIPIIALTANAMQGDKETCLSAGMNDYLSKPIDIKLLETKLNSWLKTDFQL